MILKLVNNLDPSIISEEYEEYMKSKKYKLMKWRDKFRKCDFEKDKWSTFLQKSQKQEKSGDKTVKN